MRTTDARHGRTDEIRTRAAKTTAAPATNWREEIAPDEATRYEEYARILAGLQSAATQKIGRAGRALHRKGHLGADASFEVFGNLPEPYAAGFFARPGSYRAYVRFSNGSHIQGSDRSADVRGLAVKVIGVPGKKLIPGLEAAPTQDFLAIHSIGIPQQGILMTGTVANV